MELQEKKLIFNFQFDPPSIDNTEENRRMHRQLLTTAEGLEKYTSGVILFEKTARQSTESGKRSIDLTRKKKLTYFKKTQILMKVISTLIKNILPFATLSYQNFKQKIFTNNII